MQRSDNRVAKFMMHWDGPYEVVQVWPNSSVYTVDKLPEHSNAFPTFHTSLLKPYVENNNALYPSRARETEPTLDMPGDFMLG